jgi:hypothetical protein
MSLPCVGPRRMHEDARRELAPYLNSNNDTIRGAARAAWQYFATSRKATATPILGSRSGMIFYEALSDTGLLT